MNDTNSAKQAARRLYKKVCFQDGALGNYQLQSLLSTTYEHLKIPFKASSNDIKLYEQVLDADRDGKVTLRDLEARAVEYLCSNTLISSISSSSGYKGSYKKQQEVTTDYQNYNSNANYSSYSNYEDSNPISSGYGKETVKYSEYSQNSYEPKYQTQQPAAYSFNYKPSFQTVEKNETSLSGFGNDTVYTYEKNSVFSQSGYESNQGGQASNSGSGSERAYQTYNPAPVSTETDYTLGYTAKSYGGMDSSNVNSYNYGQTYAQQPAQEVAYQTNHNNQRPYSQTVRQYLQVVGKVFLQYADPEAYNVTENEVPNLLTDTYAILGREGYIPSRQDVETWMKLCDVNNDGKVEYQEYQYFVVKSLERSGLSLYD